MRIPVFLRTVVLAVTVFSSGLLTAIPNGAAQSVFSEFFSWIVKPSAPKSKNLKPAPRVEDPYMLGPRTVRPKMNYGSWKYRTVCVRLCDGYYFPINHSSSRGNFYSDAQQCQSRCRGQTQLFYMPSHTSDINQARSVSGKAYKQIENAFLYRKKYVPSCTCRPAPWSPEERARHAMYAAPTPKVVLNDEVLDKVAVSLKRPAADQEAKAEPDPYLQVASTRVDSSNHRRTVRKTLRRNQMGLGVKPRKVNKPRSRPRASRNNWKNAILGGSLN